MANSLAITGRIPLKTDAHFNSLNEELMVDASQSWKPVLGERLESIQDVVDTQSHLNIPVKKKELCYKEKVQQAMRKLGQNELSVEEIRDAESVIAESCGGVAVRDCNG